MALDTDFTNIFFKPLIPYLNNPNTAEIMVNAYDDIWVEDEKGMYKIPETFSPDALDAAVKALAQYVGRPIIDNVFAIDARMPDKSRICIMLPPVSGDSPAFSIRLFKSAISDLGFLIDKGSLTQEMVEAISAMVKIKKNMLVAGGTSSGKTTLLNLIAATIPNDDRIITIEDSKELQLKQEHILSLEARPADKNGNGAFSIRDCLKSTLRLRPDRIVVGEIRGGESFDLIQAMNTGHGGCMGTVHANNALETLKRMESIALMADIEIPLIALRSMLASALDLVISPARLIDHSRKVIQIAEVLPLDSKENYQVADIAKYTSTKFDPVSKKLDGYFEFTGHVPTFFDMFAAEGVDIPIEFFRKRIVGELPSNETCEKLRAEGYEIAGFTNKTIITDKKLIETTKETIEHIAPVSELQKEEIIEETISPVVEPEVIETVNEIPTELSEIQYQEETDLPGIEPENNSLLERLQTINNTKQQINEVETEEALEIPEKVQQQKEIIQEPQEEESTLPVVEPEFTSIENNQDFFTLDDIQDFDANNPILEETQQQPQADFVLEEAPEPIISENTPEVNNIFQEPEVIETLEETQPEPTITNTSDSSSLTDDEIFNNFINGNNDTVPVTEELELPEIQQPLESNFTDFQEESTNTFEIEETQPQEQQEINYIETLSEELPEIEKIQEESQETTSNNSLQDKIQQSKDKQASTIASIIKRMRNKNQEQ